MVRFVERLAEISDADFFDSDSRKEHRAGQQLHMRQAVRAIVFDTTQGVFLLNVSASAYHKLPGGGVKQGESYEEALARELLEEIGAKAHIVGEVGKIVEHRERYNFTQTSYCYIAKQYGDLVAPELEENELAEGFKQYRAETQARRPELRCALVDDLAAQRFVSAW